MINYKLDNNLQDWNSWHEIKTILVKGDPNAQQFVLEDTLENAEQNEQVIQSWKKIAVFKASAPAEIAFRIGFIKDEMNLVLNHAFKTNLAFGMRIGPSDTQFYVIPDDFSKTIDFKLIEITEEGDSNYSDLILL